MAELWIGEVEAMSIPAGEDHVDATVEVFTSGLSRSRCTLTHTFTPDRPDLDSPTQTLQPETSQVVSLRDGSHRFQLACPSSAGTLRSERLISAFDRLPERCHGWEFGDAPLSATTLDALEDGMIGSWIGCVTTPWVPPYWVDLTFRSDGTYSAVSTEVLDEWEMIAMYYGTDRDKPNKRWALTDIDDSGSGVGRIEIAWDDHDHTNPDELRNVELMGDQLRFELIHLGEYGPVTFEVHRTDRPGV